jgi:Tfp pilus assembly protein PilN
MRAVNLIPAEEAVGRSGGKTGVAPYAVIGALAVVLVMSALYVMTGRSVQDKQRDLADVTAQAQAAETRAASLKSFSDYANMRKARVQTVQSLVATRYDWADTLHEVARTLPTGTWITSLRATVSPTVSVDGTPDSLRGSLPVPAIELSGCATSHSAVAATMASLRRMSGVQRVSLTGSQKAGGGAVGTAKSEGATGCGTHPQFSLTVFLEPPANTATTSTATGGTTP